MNDSTDNKNAVLTLMHAHRSHRALTGVVDDDTLHAILRAAQSASTYAFWQNTHVIIIDDRQKLASIAQLSHQSYIENAPRFLLFCADFHQYHTLDQSLRFDDVEHVVAASIDAGVFAQNVLLAAQSLGFAGVFCGKVRQNIQKIATLLQLPADTVPLFGLCLGHALNDAPKHTRLPLDLIISHNRYEAKNAKDFRAYGQSVHLKDAPWHEYVVDLLRHTHADTADYLKGLYKSGQS